MWLISGEVNSGYIHAKPPIMQLAFRILLLSVSTFNLSSIDYCMLHA